MCKTFIMTLLFNTSSAAPCNRPLGLSSGRLPNNRMTASSEVNQFYAARLARLGRGKRGKYSGAWCSRHKNHYQWLKVDFGRLMKITQVLTQGRQDYGQWVTSYYLSSSVDNVHWAMYRFRSGNKVRRNALRYIIPWQFYDLDVIFGFASSLLDVPFWIIESAGCQQRTETEMSKRKRVLNLSYYFSTFFCIYVTVFKKLYLLSQMVPKAFMLKVINCFLYTRSSSKLIVIKTALSRTPSTLRSMQDLWKLTHADGIDTYAWGSSIMDVLPVSDFVFLAIACMVFFRWGI